MRPAVRPADDAIDLALARSVVYRAITLGLRPRAEGADDDASRLVARAALRGSAALLDEAMGPFSIGPAVAAYSEGAATPVAVRLADHARLFGHSRGLVCPFETEYGAEGAFRQPQELADIAGTYIAFGLQPAHGRDERVDHVGCQCEFMDFLARKEAHTLARAGTAEETGDEQESLSTVRGAARGFLRAHLGRFGRAFASRLMKEADGGFHGRLGALLFAWLTQECRRFDLPPGPPTLEIRPPAPDEAPMACGSGEDALIQVQRRPCL